MLRIFHNNILSVHNVEAYICYLRQSIMRYFMEHPALPFVLRELMLNTSHGIHVVSSSVLWELLHDGGDFTKHVLKDDLNYPRTSSHSIIISLKTKLSDYYI